MQQRTKTTLTPLAAGAAVFFVDQASKLAVISAVGYGKTVSLIGDALRFSPRVRSFVVPGAGAFPFFQITAFIALPLLVWGTLVFFYFRSRRLSHAARLSLAAVIGGGWGNLFDRFTHAGGVVEYIDLDACGLFALPRWPAFNAADAAVVVGTGLFCMLLILRLLRKRRRGGKTQEA